jgi:ATP-dependent Lhr-like helicase
VTAFERLSPALQYQIVHGLGFRELRPVQDASIPPILDGKNCVVLAPTAGGKTESAFFPLISAMDAGDWRAPSVLYLSPTRALINDQEGRVARYAGLVGRRAFKWHGDTPDNERRRFLSDPADILLITPEALEAMLMSARVPAQELLASVRAVVIDEVHAFAADDRGAHLTALLERVSRVGGRDLQRIGLSATVGNPADLLRWLQGSSKRDATVVNPEGARAVAEVTIDYVGSLENAATVIKALHPGRKRLVFVDSRGKAEDLGRLLSGLGVMVFVTHGSLSLPERRDAEKAFHEGSDCVVVATSALELGVDVGDLDHVLQIDAPGTVASFLQRLGRTGRRPDTSSNFTFLATTDAAVLQAAAIVQLFREAFVEPLVPNLRSSHIFAHQVMSLAIQESGIPRGAWDTWLDGATAFSELPREDRAAVVDHMLASDILADQGGKLWLGPAGEKRYGRANFRELYAVFSTPKLITVRWDTREIGTVDAQFLSMLDREDEPGTFTLAGRSWQIVNVEWERAVCVVKPAPSGRRPRWAGSPRPLGFALCQAMKRVLVSEADDASWSRRAREVLARMKAEHTYLSGEAAPMAEDPKKITWWTFAGGAANLLIARLLEEILGPHAAVKNTSITFTEDAGKSLVALRQALDKLKHENRPNAEDADRLAGGGRRSRVSKFEPCLPPGELQRLLATSLLDVEGARRVIGEVSGEPRR